jgi:hypothetical protein
MKRKTFLTIVSCIAMLIGVFSLTLPSVLLESVKVALPSETANVMACTVGVLLISIGILNFMVRGHEDSPTLKSVLIANLILQLGIMPIDPIAYLNGVFTTLGSFMPNTILHIILACGFAYYLSKMKGEKV